MAGGPGDGLGAFAAGVFALFQHAARYRGGGIQGVGAAPCLGPGRFDFGKIRPGTGHIARRVYPACPQLGDELAAPGPECRDVQGNCILDIDGADIRIEKADLPALILELPLKCLPREQG